MTTVAVLEIQDCMASSAAITHDMMTTANGISAAAKRPLPFDVRTVRCGPRRNGRNLRGAELVIVPGLGVASADELDAKLKSPACRRAGGMLVDAFKSGAMLAASCASTFLLADVGLLDGRRATTTWWFAPIFRRRYPKVELVADQMVVADWPIATGGAAMAQMDLMLAVVARFAGPRLARTCANYLLLDERHSQAPFMAITYLAGLTTEALRTRLASLPEQSLVYYLVANRDGAGQSVHPLEYLDDLAAVANAPIYCWVDSAIGHGTVGGNLKSQTAETAAVARLAVRVLRGEPAEAIPMSTANLNVAQVDWRELRHWGIPEARVPHGTLVLFREPTVWDRYKRVIVGAAALVFAQTMLIASLLVQRARRRRAEAEARASEQQLQTSFERIRDLGGRLLNAQETERATIARELHDDIGQQVILLSIDLELLLQGQAEPARLAGEALSLTQSLAKSVHDLSHRLHPARLRLIGLVPALQGLQHELSASGIPITFTHDSVPSPLPPDVTLCVFRTVQEALQNALKSAARQISVRLIGSAHQLALTVADDGVGFDVKAAWGEGLGLIRHGRRLKISTARSRFARRPAPARRSGGAASCDCGYRSV